jgi:hypothetical protein
MLEKIKNITEQQRRLLLLTAGVLIGVFGFGAYRFASYNPEHTHYHANFAVYINGEKEQFEGFSYYEELTGCSLDTTPTARGRVHMHEPENSVVHIHDEAVTWGHFFENLGFSIGSDHLATGTDVYTSDDTSVTYVLNGKKVIGNPAAKEIGDEDRLLVVVGAESDEEALEFFDSVVPDDAHEHNESSDPGTCSSGESHGFTDRLKEVF